MKWMREEYGKVAEEYADRHSLGNEHTKFMLANAFYCGMLRLELEQNTVMLSEMKEGESK